MPLHHTRSHEISTPRLIIRSAVASDARAICELRSDPANSPHEPVEQNLSPEIMEQRIAKWTAASSDGRNGFMVIVLLPSNLQHRSMKFASTAAANPVGHDAAVVNKEGVETIIGFGGFNSFSYIPSRLSDDPDNKILVGDIGVMIDHKYWRRGYGVEALTAIVEYGFEQLGCGRMFMGTEIHNVAWRTMMNKTLGLAAYETREKAEAGPSKGADGFAWKFGKDEWEDARSRGRW